MFIKKLPILALISSKKNFTRVLVKPPQKKRKIRRWGQGGCIGVPARGGVAFAALTSVAYLCHSPSPHVLPGGIKNCFTLLFGCFLIALFYGLKHLQIGDFIKLPPGCCSSWGPGYSYRERSENIFILVALKRLRELQLFPNGTTYY